MGRTNGLLEWQKLSNYEPKVHPLELGMLAHFMPAVEFKNSPMNWNTIDGTSLGCLKSDGLALVKHQQKMDTWSGSLERRRNISMGWHSLSGKRLQAVSSAACLSQADSSPSGCPAKPHNMTIIQVYAPTTDHDDEEVKKFYKLLESTITEVPKRDILIIQGDWNAKVGPDAYENWAGTVGRFGIGETNDRGLRLLEFTRGHCLTLANTLHPHKLSQTATWHSNNGQVHNQIDFILAPQCFKSSINKAKMKIFPGTNLGSDHDLMMTTFKLKLKAKHWPKNTHIDFNLEKLKDPKIAKVFQAQVGGKFTALNLIDSNVEMIAGNIKEVLLTTAEEVLGKRWKKIQLWITNEVLDLCNRRWELRGKKHSSNKAWAWYQNVHRQVRKKIQNSQRGMDRGTVQHPLRKAWKQVTAKMPTAISNPSPKLTNWEQLA